MSDETLNWSDLANTRLGEVEPPKMIPPGHYAGVITGAGKVDKNQKGTLFIEFPVQLREPMDDVDSEAFAASDGFSKGGYKITFYLTPGSLFRFTEFCKGMGVSDDLSVPEAAEALASLGEPLVVHVQHGQSQKNPGRTYLNLDDPVPLAAFQQQAA